MGRPNNTVNTSIAIICIQVVLFAPLLQQGSAFILHPRIRATQRRVVVSPLPETRTIARTATRHSPYKRYQQSSTIINCNVTPLPYTPSHRRMQRHVGISPVVLHASSIGDNNENSNNDYNPRTIRGRLRRLTGFSLTAFRATMRATTGFSLTALRATLRAATGVSITGLMKRLLSVFPLWARYFIQPLLILYYTPLMIFRGLVGPTKDSRANALQAHEQIVEEWKSAVKVAGTVNERGYWPIRVNDDGFIEAVMPPDPDAVLDMPDVAE